MAKSEEPEDGEDLEENLDKDYQDMPELDQYEQVGMDNDDYDAMAVDDRRAAEKELVQNERLRDRT